MKIIDDFSRKLWAYFLKHKNEAFSTFKEWKLLIKNQTSKKINRLRTNNGLEFCSNEFNDFCKKEDIFKHLNIPRTPQQNGIAERMNKTILERVRCMLSHSGLRKSFWAEAASTTCYLINHSPNRSIDCNIPEEFWSGNPVDYSNLKRFGCLSYSHVNEGKLEPCAKKCIFLGYGSGFKHYRLYDPKSHKVIQSRNVTFNENAMLSYVKDIVISSIDIGDQEDAREKVEFEIKTPAHEED